MNTVKTGILLVNLGSPDSTEVKDVRRYLDEFLMDGNVIDVPWLLRALIVKGFILPFRPKESAHAYSQIWWEEGSPLIVISERVQQLVQDKMAAPVELGMRYGNPSIESAIKKLLQRMPDLEKVFMIPLYPHYAMASTKTVIDKAKEVIKKNGWQFKFNYLESFYNEEHYINALAESIRPHLAKNYDKILFSYHGIPYRHLRKVDPTGSHCTKVADCCNVDSPAHKTCYKHQCYVTTKLVTEKLGLTADQFHVSFQSRLAGDKWLQPYTDYEIERFAKEGVKNLGVICPAFVSDCLETLEEVGMRGKEDFIEAGGENLDLIPCLNENPVWIDTLLEYCKPYVGASASAEQAS